jgi:hypothetical protein
VDALLVAVVPLLFGLAIGRWWLILMVALPAATMAVQGAAAGLDAGPLAVITAGPVAAVALGVAARSYLRNGGMSMSSSLISSDDR